MPEAQGVQTVMVRYLWCHQPPRHDKVWICEVVAQDQGAVLRRRWGRRGGPLTDKIERFGSVAVALDTAHELVESKLGRYTECDPTEIGVLDFEGEGE
jgi:predicted DNA-binding WGR domain protein